MITTPALVRITSGFSAVAMAAALSAQPPAAAGPAAPATAQTPAATESAAATAATPAPETATAGSTIAETAAATPELATLAKAVTAASLEPTLAGAGPITVFAPTDAAFGRLQAGTLDTLLKPESKPTLAKILKYHVVPGNVTVADLTAKITAGGGNATLTTVEGSTLTAKLLTQNGGQAIELTDQIGNKAYIEKPDVKQANGVVHIVNGVLSPKLG